MSGSIHYDDTNLQRLFAEMDPKKRMKAMKGAFRRAALKVRKVAVENLRQSLNSNRELERGVRALVWKRKAGFRVTVGTKGANKKGKGAKGYYISRRRRNSPKATGKPVLVWAEKGTVGRFTRKGWGRKGHATGRMKRYGFMSKALHSVRDSVTANLQGELRESIIRISRKYGCT